MKVAVVGCGLHIERLVSTIASQNNSVVINNVEVKHPTYFKPAQTEYIIEALPTYDYEKKFICKGKHQYREVAGEWICQCTRKIND